jgi:putative transcriptional regulator
MIRQHPSETTLLAQAAGTLAPLHSVVLSVHLAACPVCRDEVRHLEEVGGALLSSLPPERMAPGALAWTMAQLDGPPSGHAAKQPASAAVGPQSSLVVQLAPAVLQADLVRQFATGRWIWLGPGIRLMPLQRRDASGTRLDLIRVAAGVALPSHSHTGPETACILQGGFSDEAGEYGVLDIAEGDAALHHVPIASPGEDCVCLIATTGRLRAHSWLARLVQPLVGV